MIVAAGGSRTERRTESLLGNRQTEGHLLGPSVQEQTPNRTPFCSAPLFVSRGSVTPATELAGVTALMIMIREFLKAQACFRLQRKYVAQPVMDCSARRCHIVASVYSSRPWHHLMPGLCSIDAKPESSIPALPHIRIPDLVPTNTSRCAFVLCCCALSNRHNCDDAPPRLGGAAATTSSPESTPNNVGCEPLLRTIR